MERAAMTRETKIGLLIGLGVILLIGIIVSDHLSVMDQPLDGDELSRFSQQVERSIQPPALNPSTSSSTFSTSPTSTSTPPGASSLSHSPLRRSPGRVSSPADGLSHGRVRQVRPIPTPRDLMHPTSPPTSPVRIPEEATDPPPARRAPQAYAANHGIALDTDRGDSGRAVQRQVVPTIVLQQQDGDSESPGRDSRDGRVDSHQLAMVQQPLPIRPVEDRQQRTMPTKEHMANSPAEVAVNNQPIPELKRPADVSRPVNNDWEHKVKPGESLYSIANQYYGNGEYWHVIAAANTDKVGDDGGIRSDINLIVPHDPSSFMKRQAILAAQHSRTPDGSPPPSGERPGTVTVRTGDTLSGIARSYLGNSSRWDEILDANSNVLGSPEKLQAGMVLRLPRMNDNGQAGRVNDVVTRDTGRSSSPSAPARSYRVLAGDTLSSIAKKMLGSHEAWRRIYQVNQDVISDPDRLKVGDLLQIPN